MLYPLSELLPGTHAVIQEIHNSDVKLKLMEMGCMPGAAIVVETIAPMGDPIAICVAGYVLSLRKNEAKYIQVTKA